MNHEIPHLCPRCGTVYDERVHWGTCPQCGCQDEFVTPMSDAIATFAQNT